jgi:Rieske Fe-S protein
MDEENNKETNQTNRRDFLGLVSLGIFASIVGTIAVSAFRFLRPPSKARSAERWTDIAPIAELKGDGPITQSIIVEKTSGWATKTEEQFVFVLPNKQHQALSSVCPHEGCQVVWRDESKQFVCPCHDSFFSSDGARLSGPAQRDLDSMPTRTKDGVLQVRYE